jgi:hypothetical protein
MDYCPNCGRIAGGRFCQFCGYDTTLMAPQQQTQYTSQPYQPPVVPAQVGPPVGPRIEKSPHIKTGTILVIICIIGIILSLAIPWITVQREDYDGNVDSFSFNYDLELVVGDEDKWGYGFQPSDEYTSSDELEDYLKGTIGQSFLGLILAIVIAIGFIMLGIKSSAVRFPGKVSHGIGAFIGAILLIPGMMIIVTGINFLGLEIIELHSQIIEEERGSDITSETFYPAAYLMLIFGFIILIIAFIIIRNELRYMSLYKQTHQGGAQQQSMPPTYPGGGVYG